jgi:hypothetical protein
MEEAMTLLATTLFAAKRIQGVVGTFVDATNAFNDNDWDTYAQYLDEDVVAYNLSVPGHTNGSIKVTEYFRRISTGNNLDLQFEPTNDITWWPGPYPLSVRGVALWTHKDSHHVRVPIKYKFQFSPGESYLLTAVWAQHLVGD